LCAFIGCALNNKKKPFFLSPFNRSLLHQYTLIESIQPQPPGYWIPFLNEIFQQEEQEVRPRGRGRSLQDQAVALDPFEEVSRGRRPGYRPSTLEPGRRRRTDRSQDRVGRERQPPTPNLNLPSSSSSDEQ